MKGDYLSAISFFEQSLILLKKDSNNMSWYLEVQVIINLINKKEVVIKELEDLKKETPIKNTNLNVDDFDYSQNFQNNEIYFNEILAVDDVWLEIKDSNDSSIIATLLKKNETFSIPNEEGLTITLSNAGVVKIKNGDTKILNSLSFQNVDVKKFPSIKLIKKIISNLKKNDAVIPVIKINDATKIFKKNILSTISLYKNNKLHYENI